MDTVYTFKVRGREHTDLFRRLMVQGFAVNKEREWGQHVIYAVDAQGDQETVEARIAKATDGLKKVTRI